MSARKSRSVSDRARRGFPITAWSTVNGLGTTTEQVMSALRSGQALLSPPPFGTPFDTVCGVVVDDLAALPETLKQLDSRNNRFVQQALSEIEVSLDTARDRWGAERIGICVGSSTAAMDEIESVYATHAETGAIPSGFDVFAMGSFDGLVRALRGLTGRGAGRRRLERVRIQWQGVRQREALDRRRRGRRGPGGRRRQSLPDHTPWLPLPRPALR